MLGPLIGSGLTQRAGFEWACTLMACFLLLHVGLIGVLDVVQPRPRMKAQAAYTELTQVSVPLTESADD